MIHSALFIPISSNNLYLNGEHLKNLQKKLESIEYLIINEKSMVGLVMKICNQESVKVAFSLIDGIKTFAIQNDTVFFIFNNMRTQFPLQNTLSLTVHKFKVLHCLIVLFP